ncbi:MAG: hypothetical protein ACTHKF_01930 [Candidatus Nitrosocosmicus sp.]
MLKNWFGTIAAWYGSTSPIKGLLLLLVIVIGLSIDDHNLSHLTITER